MKFFCTLFTKESGGISGGKVVLTSTGIIAKSPLNIIDEEILYTNIVGVTYSLYYPKLKIHYVCSNGNSDLVVLSISSNKIIKELKKYGVKCVKYKNPHNNIYNRIIFWFKYWN